MNDAMKETMMLEMTDEDRERSNVELNACKAYLNSRLQLTKEVAHDTAEFNKRVGLILGAIAHTSGDFLGFATDNPEVGMQHFNTIFETALLGGTVERLIRDAELQQGVQTAP